MSAVQCPCCGEASFQPFLNFSHVPLSGVFRKALADAIPHIDLKFDLCMRCGLVRQVASSGPREYVAVTRSTALQFPKYVHELIANLKHSGVGPDDLVLEIGSNDGLFLSALRDAGFKRVVGVEPSQDLAAAAQAKGHTVVCDYFGPDLVPRLVQDYGLAKAVICRHTLEHVPAPDVFVGALAHCLAGDDALALIEVPDGSAIPDLLNVYEFWDEHLSCFSKNNLRLLLNRAGLQVTGTVIQPHLETRNLLAWCKKSDIATRVVFDAEDAACVALWQSLLPRWAARKAGFASAVQQAPKPIYVVGASHSQTNLINYSGLGKHIDFFIDDDLAKVGLVPPVADTQAAIISTNDFEKSATGGTLVKAGFGYEKWTQRLCTHAALHGMMLIDPENFN
jgi:SAM-dependent methyltransferase